MNLVRLIDGLHYPTALQDGCQAEIMTRIDKGDLEKVLPANVVAVERHSLDEVDGGNVLVALAVGRVPSEGCGDGCIEL